MRPVVQPIGIADLKVTKQRLVRYAAGEVAHIENVLARERRGRVHRRLRQVEEITVTEREREEESRRDLQSTERFELENETQRTIRSETTFEAGIELSGGFGPVNVTAYAKYANNQSAEESDRNATRFAKEVVDKTVSRLAERVREERRARTFEEVEETNEHGFSSGRSSVTGVYRWVDKYYRQKVVNYGKRLMYEFVVPEPAAFYLFAQRFNYESKVLPAKPAVPTVPDTNLELTPGAITRTNYMSLVKQSGATGVEPPPPDRIVVTKPLSRETPQSGMHWAFTNEDLVIPKGYRADHGFYWVQYTWRDNPAAFSGALIVGTNNINIGNYPSLDFYDDAVDRIPVSGTGYDIRSFAINIEVVCVLLDEAFEKWQIATYDAVMTAYQRALLDYEERLAAAQVQQGVTIEGNNPAINRETEKEELKHACLWIWAGPDIDLQPAISHLPASPVPDNYPRIIRSRAVQNAEQIEFFERAFDWRNIAYELHPYFWGRDETWLDRNAIKSTDPLLERFLKSGAATVTVPVQPSFTEAVLWYQLTGDIWSGGPIPALESTGEPDAVLYNSYLDEMEDVSDVVEIEADVEILPDDPDAWIVRIPTTLVWLQPGPALPDLEPSG
jgi:hypothetical protein